VLERFSSLGLRGEKLLLRRLSFIFRPLFKWNYR
jgi:hypothetical protein